MEQGNVKTLQPNIEVLTPIIRIKRKDGTIEYHKAEKVLVFPKKGQGPVEAVLKDKEE